MTDLPAKFNSPEYRKARSLAYDFLSAHHHRDPAMKEIILGNVETSCLADPRFLRAFLVSLGQYAGMLADAAGRSGTSILSSEPSADPYLILMDLLKLGGDVKVQRLPDTPAVLEDRRKCFSGPPVPEAYFDIYAPEDPYPSVLSSHTAESLAVAVPFSFLHSNFAARKIRASTGKLTTLPSTVSVNHLSGGAPEHWGELTLRPMDNGSPQLFVGGVDCGLILLVEELPRPDHRIHHNVVLFRPDGVIERVIRDESSVGESHTHSSEE